MHINYAVWEKGEKSESKENSYLILRTPRLKISCGARLNNIIRILWICLISNFSWTSRTLEIEPENLDTQIGLHTKKTCQKVREVNYSCISQSKQVALGIHGTYTQMIYTNSEKMCDNEYKVMYDYNTSATS